MTQVFVDAQVRLEAGARVDIEGGDSHHLTRVLRARPGDLVTLCNGQGLVAQGRLVSASQTAVVEILQDAEHVERSEPMFTCQLAVIKGERMDWAVQKLVELGVHRVEPVLFERSVVRLDPERATKKQRRWTDIARGAAAQSEQAYLAEVAKPRPLTEVAGASSAELRLHMCETRPSATIAVPPATASCAFVIGPEGGLTTHERQLLANQGYQAVSLGPSILRTETAAMAAQAVLSFVARDSSQ